MSQKIIIYQVFTRLFGNKTVSLQVNGNIQENGCGKMADFTAKALNEIKNLGATHIWYTGIIEHATQTDYSSYGILPDHPAVVKGKAGSPYAIKDYYDVDPDLAVKVEYRMKEFENLVNRTHKAGLKMIIDFVPNHVARQYHSDQKPEGVEDLGARDNKGMGFDPQNNFYYIPNEPLHLDNLNVSPKDYLENPAKATGNDVFSAWPGQNDWYETIKLNYGVDYCNGRTCCFDPIPDTWKKMLDILCFWATKGIDGFRCDMAEMVPVEFWGWAIPQVKALHPSIIFIAEVYNPAEYRNYIHKGHFDYLYDKVGLYDTLRAVSCGYTSAGNITSCWQQVNDIQAHMLNFLENHDEQRIASDFFAGNARKGKAPLLVSACMRSNPMMIYFGQEFGEKGMDQEGFSGRDGRTTIFDYWSVDTIRRWRKGSLSMKYMTTEEKELYDFYQKVLTLCNKEKALSEGDFYDLMYVQAPHHFDVYNCYAFLRRYKNTLLLVVANFSNSKQNLSVCIPAHVFEFYEIKPLEGCIGKELISGNKEKINILPDTHINLEIPAYGGCIWKFTI
ncbi:MAG: alpha-amylase [Candidatus Paraprevotella stercoravium]|uniref:Alpha-amylase n=1 Tax=Candidatus Paraprevotella stercoravium TaxID=2838725 RepID=A0A9E2L4G8_9BACT|nr:alpha-amylase [Candidatus Paraprevotella stercoravium]